MSANTWEQFMSRVLVIGINSTQAAIRIAIIIFAAYIIAKILRITINRFEGVLIRAAQAAESAASASMRIRTLTSVLWTISTGLLWFIVVLIALGQIGVNIGPILAGAGVLGLAVGFGAQHLVRDLVSGFFLLLENQVRVGDTAIINGTSGTVESVTFRTVVLRDPAGVVYVFPNGSITTLANATMDWSGYLIDVTFSFKEDAERVIEVMQKAADELQADAAFGRLLIAPVEIFGIDNFTETTVTVKARCKTLPGEQQWVGREYRRRLKKAFDAAGTFPSLSSRLTTPAPTATA
jgi:small conductance mechanosensitive channel